MFGRVQNSILLSRVVGEKKIVFPVELNNEDNSDGWEPTKQNEQA